MSRRPGRYLLHAAFLGRSFLESKNLIDLTIEAIEKN